MKFTFILLCIAKVANHYQFNSKIMQNLGLIPRLLILQCLQWRLYEHYATLIIYIILLSSHNAATCNNIYLWDINYGAKCDIIQHALHMII